MKKSSLKTARLLCMLSSCFLTSISHGQSLLWEISGNGLDKASYLFGTIHLTCGDYKLDKKVSGAMSKTNAVYFEIDMDDPQLLLTMQRHALNKDLKNLQDELTPEQTKQINQFLVRHYGEDLSKMGIMKPFALLSMILIKNTPCEKLSSVEQMLLSESQKRKIDVHGLESIAYQIGLFDSIPVADQVSWILEAVSESYSDQYEAMVTAYRNEDLDELERLITESPGMADYQDLLLTRRNQDWIPIMIAQMEQEPVFFAVGAGHLTGQNGLIQLLLDKGYQLEPVN